MAANSDNQPAKKKRGPGRPFTKGDARINRAGVPKQALELKAALKGEGERIHASLMKLIDAESVPAILYAHKALFGQPHQTLEVDLDAPDARERLRAALDDLGPEEAEGNLSLLTDVEARVLDYLLSKVRGEPLPEAASAMDLYKRRREEFLAEEMARESAAGWPTIWAERGRPPPAPAPIPEPAAEAATPPKPPAPRPPRIPDSEVFERTPKTGRSSFSGNFAGGSGTEM